VALAALESDAAVTVAQSATRITMEPVGGARATGLVFYPGAKVDPRAYAHLLRPVAEAGYPVTILKLPFNLAIASPAAAASVVDDERDVTRWVVGGHSLGGTMAARFASRNPVDGLLLWASYPAGSLAASTDLDVLSVSGSEDGLATPAEIEDSRADLPPGAEFVVVEGAVHAFFGDYGEQSGDGTPTVSREEAQAAIVAATLAQLDRVDRATASG
jgi:dienelactone hydrolase